MNRLIDEDIDCIAWREPHKRLEDLPRIKQDKAGVAIAARDIIKHEGIAFARGLLDNPLTDRRLLRPIRVVLAYANYQDKAS